MRKKEPKEQLSIQGIHQLSSSESQSEEVAFDQNSPLTEEAMKLYNKEDKAKIESIIKKFSDQSLSRKSASNKQQRMYAFLGVFALILIAVLTAVFIF